MDIGLLISVATLIAIMIVVCTVFLARKSRGAKQETDVPQRPQGRPVRRAAGQRIARRRMQANVNQQAEVEQEDESGDDASDEADDKPEFPCQKVGAKKRAKLAAKAEKRIQREALEREREDRKKREQLLQEERDKQSEKERADEQRKEEEEQKERERKEQQEYEEYLRMKEAFSIEEEGYDEEEKEDEENLLQEFINYIKENKVVVLEDLAAHFGIKAANAVERIQQLQANGNLTGVIDDRGKFIYISQEELDSVAKFVRQRGRVSLAELVENSNQLINLNPNKRCTLVEAR